MTFHLPLIVLMLFVLTVISLSSAASEMSCDSLFEQIINTPRIVEAIWFPHASHMELRVNDRLYRVDNVRSHNPRHMESLVMSRTPYVSFRISATNDDIDNLLRVIDEDNISEFRTCSSAANYKLKKANLFSVPHPFTVTPMMTALYLTVVHKLGFKEITKITVGRKKEILKIIPLLLYSEDVLGSILIVGAEAFVIVWAVNALGERVQILISLLSPEKFDR